MGKGKFRWKRRKTKSYNTYQQRGRGKSPYHWPLVHGDPFAEPNGQKRHPRPEHSIQKGIAGFVERINGKEAGQDFRDKRIVVGYFEGMKIENGYLKTVFSDAYPIYIFDVRTGEVSKGEAEPKDATGNYVLRFPHKPAAPQIHQRWESDDPENPRKAFGPHARRVIGQRIMEMDRKGFPNSKIRTYKKQANEFMELAETLFVSGGNALAFYTDIGA